MHLSDDTLLRFAPARAGGDEPQQPRWQTIKLGVTPRLGLVLHPGDVVALPPTRARKGDVGLITLGPAGEAIAGDLSLEVRWRFAAGERRVRREIVLARATVAEVDRDEPWISHEFSLQRVADSTGSIVFAVKPGWRFWRNLRDIAVYELATSNPGSLDLERARSFRSLRIRNEQANFDAYYQHAVFQQKAEAPAAPPQQEAETSREDGSLVPSSPPEAQAARPKPPAVTALEYSRSRLAERIKLDPPPFGWLLRKKVDALLASRAAGDRSKVRVLSICSGAARIEADMVRHLPHEGVSLTLLDVNRNLLDLAQRALEPWGPIETIVADVNELDLRDRTFDVVLCVSALHHVVELEHVVEQIARAIGESGQFWSIGETLGRNGGRMLDEPYKVANEYFVGLDERYRRNRITGVVDKALPNLDYSIGCFEGIRCEAIEPALLRFLTPVHVAKHNCIVHRLFSLSYSDNFDMALGQDRALVDAAVELDAALHRHGGYDVELNGVYRRTT